MRRAQIIVSLVLLLLVGGYVANMLYQRAQPHHKGKPLAFWVARLGANSHPNSYDHIQAVAIAGTNGIPYYLNWIQSTTSLTKQKALDLANSALGIFVNSWRIQDGPALRAAGAIRAFSLLASDARSAEPGLEKLLTHPNAEVRKRATNALRDIERSSSLPLQREEPAPD